MQPAERRRLEKTAVVLGLVALAAVLLPALQPVRPLLVLPAFLVLPGAATMVALRVDSVLSWVVLSVLLSLAVQTLVALVLLWCGAWHPMLQLGVVGLVAATVLLVSALRSRSAESARRADEQ